MYTRVVYVMRNHDSPFNGSDSLSLSLSLSRLFARVARALFSHSTGSLAVQVFLKGPTDNGVQLPVATGSYGRSLVPNPHRCSPSITRETQLIS
jgi:hypothetical protein